MLTKPQKISLAIAALFFALAGVLHFLKPATYMKILPPYIPWPLAMVYVRGAAEIAGGLGLLIPSVCRGAALGLVAVYVATNPVEAGAACFHQRLSGDVCCSSQFSFGGFCGVRSLARSAELAAA